MGGLFSSGGGDMQFPTADNLVELRYPAAVGLESELRDYFRGLLQSPNFGYTPRPTYNPMEVYSASLGDRPDVIRSVTNMPPRPGQEAMSPWGALNGPMPQNGLALSNQGGLPPGGMGFLPGNVGPTGTGGTPSSGSATNFPVRIGSGGVPIQTPWSSPFGRLSELRPSASTLPPGWETTIARSMATRQPFPESDIYKRPVPPSSGASSAGSSSSETEDERRRRLLNGPDRLDTTVYTS